MSASAVYPTQPPLPVPPFLSLLLSPTNQRRTTGGSRGQTWDASWCRPDQTGALRWEQGGQGRSRTPRRARTSGCRPCLKTTGKIDSATTSRFLCPCVCLFVSICLLSHCLCPSLGDIHCPLWTGNINPKRAGGELWSSSSDSLPVLG